MIKTKPDKNADDIEKILLKFSENLHSAVEKYFLEKLLGIEIEIPTEFIQKRFMEVK